MPDKEKTIAITIKGIPEDDYYYFQLAVSRTRPKLTIKQAVINLIREFGDSERAALQKGASRKEVLT